MKTFGLTLYSSLSKQADYTIELAGFKTDRRLKDARFHHATHDALVPPHGVCLSSRFESNARPGVCR